MAAASRAAQMILMDHQQRQSRKRLSVLAMPAAQGMVGVPAGRIEPETYANQAGVQGFSENDYQPHIMQFRGRLVEDANEVETWGEPVVAGWIASLDQGQYEKYAMAFMKARINGPCLLRVTEDTLSEIGVDAIGDRFKLFDYIDQLVRRCKKPETARLTLPSWPECVVRMLDFGWANTSEGKGGQAIKEELLQANQSIALVSTLTWSIAWDLFFACATSCYCQQSSDHCYCSTAWDIDGRPLIIFYCFAGLAAFFFMFSTIYAIIQIIMVNEMSDEEEIDQFFDLLTGDSQLPGIMLFAGMICFSVPVAVYLIYNVGLGLHPGPPTGAMTAFSWIVTVFTLLITIYGFLYKLPQMIQGVYKAKIEAVEIDRQPPNHFY